MAGWAGPRKTGDPPVAALRRREVLGKDRVATKPVTWDLHGALVAVAGPLLGRRDGGVG